MAVIIPPVLVLAALSVGISAPPATRDTTADVIVSVRNTQTAEHITMTATVTCTLATGLQYSVTTDPCTLDITHPISVAPITLNLPAPWLQMGWQPTFTLTDGQAVTITIPIAKVTIK